MAQAKSRAATKRSQGTKAQGGSNKAQGSKARGKSKAQARSSRSSRSTSKSKSNNGAARVDSAKRAVEHTAKDAGNAVGRAANKAKVPLVAGGAALAGAAGGLALGMRQQRRHRRPLVGRPQVKVRSRDLAKAAKEVGTFGAEVGHLASELRRNREGANGGGRHRSPVEVVLEGLTARRSRS